MTTKRHPFITNQYFCNSSITTVFTHVRSLNSIIINVTSAMFIWVVLYQNNSKGLKCSKVWDLTFLGINVFGMSYKK